MKITKHEDICKEMTDVYYAKNADYGNSFEQLYDEFGSVSLAIRLSDKLNRYKTLLKQEAKVKDESIEDTLLDMANYCILGVMGMRNRRNSCEHAQFENVNEENTPITTNSKINRSWIDDITLNDLRNALFYYSELDCGETPCHICPFTKNMSKLDQNICSVLGQIRSTLLDLNPTININPQNLKLNSTHKIYLALKYFDTVNKNTKQARDAIWKTPITINTASSVVTTTLFDICFDIHISIADTWGE